MNPEDAEPTRYGDHMMRSRLEANWALTFDSLHISWEYEPEPITLPSGTIYLPDFWLPELGTWVEVKGDGVPRIEKAVELGQTRSCRCVDSCVCQWPGGELVLIGRPPTYCTDRTHRAWRRGGHMNWASAFGPRAWAFRCTGCESAGWTWAVRPLACRRCGKRPNGHLYGPGEERLLFARPDCIPYSHPAAPEE